MSLHVDQINLNVNINADKARNSLNDLNKEAADLTSAMKGLKKGTQDYIDKNAELKKVNDAMDELKKQIGLTSFTLKDLASEHRNLTSALNQAIPGTAEYKKFETELLSVIARQKELRSGINGVKDAQNDLKNTNEGLGGSFQKIFARVGEYLSAFAIYDTIKKVLISVVEEADKAEQASSNLLNTLENAGRTDLFEKLTEQAEKFGNVYKAISPDDIKNVFSKLIDYGKLTETQINSLTDVIINYAAKQKISVTDATDVFTKALEGNSKGLKSYGIDIKDAADFSSRLALILGPMADKVRGAETAFESTNKGALASFKEGLAQIQEKIGTFLLSLTGLADKSHEMAIAAKQEADSSQILVNRYEDLSKKVNKTTADKAELKGITAQLTATFGDSVVSINKETGALELNLEKTKDLIKQKLLLANQDAGGLALKINAGEEDNKKRIDEINVLTKALQDLGAANGVVNKDFLDPSKDYKSKDVSSFFAPGKFNQKAVDDIDKMRNQVALLKNDWNSTTDDIEKNQKKLDQFGFSAADVNKLFNPTVPKNQVIGGGDPNADAKKAAEDKYNQLLKEAQDFHKKLQELKFTAEQASKSDDQKEIDAVKHKYDDILRQYDSLQKNLNSKDVGILGPRVDITEEEQQEIDAIIEKHRKANFEKEQQETKDNLSKQYADQQQQVSLYYGGLKDQEAKRFANGEIDYKTYQANITAIDVKSNAALLKNAEDFSAQKVTINGKIVTAVDQAEKDMTAFQKAELDKRTANAIRQYIAQQAEIKLLRDLDNQAELSKAQSNVIIAQSSNNPKAESEAQKALLALQLKQKKAALDVQAAQDKTAIQETGVQRVAIEKKIDDDVKAQKTEADNQYQKGVQDSDNTLYQKRIQMAEDYANAAVSLSTNLNNLLNNIEDRKLQKLVARNNKEKAELQKQLNNKLISQKQYDLKVAALDDKADKEKQKISAAQAKRQKALDIFSAITGTAAAVVGALGSKPWGPWNIALAALVGALGAVQIGVIASAPPPEVAAGGNWFREGDKHRDPSGGIPVMIERDEAVVKADAMTDKNTYTVSGTPAQITSKLNSLHGGVNWASGAIIQTKFREPAPQINRKIVRIMSQGGLGSGATANQDSFSTMSADIKRMANMQDQIVEELKNQKTKLHAVVSIKEFRQVEKQYDNARKAAGMGG